MAKGIKLRLLDGVVPLSNLSNLICLWWDQTDVYEFDTPIGRTNVATTDIDGYLKLDISNVSGVAVGDKGFLVVYKEQTEDNYKKAPVFASIVEVKNYEGGVPLFYKVDEYVRPTDWISLGTLPTETDNKFIGLHAVFKDGPNWCAFKFTCSNSSQYTVDWGDGTSTENINSGTSVYHSFNYNNLAGNTETGISEARAVTFQDTGDTVTLSNHGFNNGTEISFSSIITTTGISTYTRYYVVNISGNTFKISDTKGGTAKTLTNDGTGAVYLPGYRQSLVTVTPTTTGKSFTALDLHIRHTSSSAVTYSTGWLDICLAAPSMTSLTIGRDDLTETVFHGALEKFNAIALGAITDCSYKFYRCYSLQSIVLPNTSNVIYFNDMFHNCTSLKSAPLLDTSSGTDFYSMFNNCYALKSVPLFDTSNCTDFSWMFFYCYSLKSIPSFNTSKVTKFDSTFFACYSLESIPLLDTSNCTNFYSVFSDCFALQSVPLLDTSSTITFSFMFTNCFALQSVPLFDTSSGTTFNSMFYKCYSLQSVPLLDTSLGTRFDYMFNECRVLESVPLLDTSNCTNFANMFNGCYSLKLVPLLDTSSGTNFSWMFANCYDLNIIPLFDTVNGTNFSYMFNSCNSLQKGSLKDVSFSISYLNCTLSADSLNQIFENLRSPTTNPCVITIFGNYGSFVYEDDAQVETGSTTLTFQEVGPEVQVGMWISESSPIVIYVTFQDSGDTVTLNNHGIPNGTRVSFSAITYTTGIQTNKIYYVVNTQTNTFQVSDTIGGTAKELTTDGTGILLYENKVLSIDSSEEITVTVPSYRTGNISVVFSYMNPYLATLKGWTIVA